MRGMVKAAYATAAERLKMQQNIFGDVWTGLGLLLFDRTENGIAAGRCAVTMSMCESRPGSHPTNTTLPAAWTAIADTGRL